MNILDIIEKKKLKQELNYQEIEYFINGYVANEIQDYQVSALLMAIVLNGMSDQETFDLSMVMRDSGDVIDLSQISGFKCDKHSTGGVGDKVSLVLAPLLAACGIKMAKMSGRGLGHTGGTIDKLESIPNFNVNLAHDDFIAQVNNINIAIVAQSGNLVPADKKIYALRDVCGCVNSIPLIASSIMSKKLASGADIILLDVKVGRGAFMENIEEASNLAKKMVTIGSSLSKQVKAVITDMNQPLGYAIGNNLEIIEVVNTLKNQGPSDLKLLSLELSSHIMSMVYPSLSHNIIMHTLEEALISGKAYQKFTDMVEFQGGDIEYIKNPELFNKASHIIKIYALKDGYIHDMDALLIGKVALGLGSGRLTKDDIIDYSAGIILKVKVNDLVKKDDVIMELHTNKDVELAIIDLANSAINISNIQNNDTALIKKVI